LHSTEMTRSSFSQFSENYNDHRSLISAVNVLVKCYFIFSWVGWAFHTS